VDVPDGLLLLLLAALLLAVGLWRFEAKRGRRARTGQRSSAARYGNLTEQFAPWMKGWPFAPAGFRFLGKPVDGVQFEEDAVYLVEIKAAGGELSPEQRKVRDLVAAGRVGWMRFDVREGRAAEVVRPWEK
jgi:predicted Holliday junction resolvase-like endonuclease